jgi:hypothetical protein
MLLVVADTSPIRYLVEIRLIGISAPTVREDIHSFGRVRRTAPPIGTCGRPNVGEFPALLVRGIACDRE